MAKWKGVITNVGIELLDSWVAGKVLSFDYAAAGTGSVPEIALMAQTDIVGQKQDTKIVGAEKVPEGYRLKLRVTAADVEYKLKQFGVWGTVGEEPAVMLAVFQHEDGIPVPSKEDFHDFVYTFFGTIKSANTGAWTVNISPNVFVTKEEMETSIADAVRGLAPAGDYELMGTAANLIEQHNSDASAHEDIRTEVQEAVAAANGAAQAAKQAATAAQNAQTAADAALEIITEVANTIGTVPSQNGSLTYTGSEQSPSWNSYDPTAMDFGGDTSGVEAGIYTATFTPKGGRKWADGTTEAKSVIWTIGRAPISTAPSQSGTLTYTGAAQAPGWANYDTAKLTIGGTTSGVNAGTYTATFTPKDNYQWPDGSTAAKSVTWSIGRATISVVPSQSGSLTYTGSALSPSWSNYDAAKLTIGGAFSATNAGSYPATFTPTADYRWSDGSTGTKSVNWSIGKAAGSLALNVTSLSLNNAAKTGTITVTRAGNGTITATSSNTGVATVSVSGNVVTVTGKASGSATITVKVAAGTNHAPANKTCTVAVSMFGGALNSNSWATIREASDAGEAANIWAVGDTKTITLNGTAGTVAFSNLSIDVFIVGFNHNASREGNNRIHFQIGKIGGKLVGFADAKYYDDEDVGAMHFQMDGGSGWSGTYMRNNVLGNSGTPTSPPTNSFMAVLPSDLRAVMKSVTKYTDNMGGATNDESHITATTDYLSLLAEFEYLGKRKYANMAEQVYQAQYDYYKAGNSAVHYRHNGLSGTIHIWTRSINFKTQRTYCLLDGGDTYPEGESWSFGISPVFYI